jgi:hypothetical protein
MRKHEYINFQNELEKAAIDNNESSLKSLLNCNKELVNSIVDEYGPGSVFLLKPYNILYSNHNYKLSGMYQDTIEKINPVALLGEDS